MKLGQLAKLLDGALLSGSAATEIKSVAYDSRHVQPGALFCALPGNRTSGDAFIEEAIRRGAVAILHEGTIKISKKIAQIQVANARRTMAAAAAAFYGDPSKKVKVIGITGTNGKSTTAFMMRHILKQCGVPAGVIGTIYYEWGNRRIPATRTTPEAPDLQRMFYEALQAGEKAIAMEVSSQGLAAQRLLGTHFYAGIFTNLTQDHLDFHGTMDDYFEAKKELFITLSARHVAPMAVNIDSAYGKRLINELPGNDAWIPFGTSGEAQVRASDITENITGVSFTVTTPDAHARVELTLPGRFNVYNALGAIAIGLTFRIPLETMAAALAGMPPVPGRLERIEDEKGRHIFVDYAHTDDALKNVLQTLKTIAPARVICVFGCGGNRDSSKRAKMGAAVSELADYAIVTSDNPRDEDPLQIISHILTGMTNRQAHWIEPDRGAAIRMALQLAEPGDIVLIAGKGHEPYQEVKSQILHFDDRETVRHYLEEGL